VESEKRYPKQSEVLGRWVSNQRQKKKNGNLSAERISTLEALSGWSWGEKQKTPWDVRLEELHAYVEREKSYPKYSEVLGLWVHAQRQSKKKNKLSPDQIAALEALPEWKWVLRHT
jgi:hypothetical protein